MAIVVLNLCFFMRFSTAIATFCKIKQYLEKIPSNDFQKENTQLGFGYSVMESSHSIGFFLPPVEHATL